MRLGGDAFSVAGARPRGQSSACAGRAVAVCLVAYFLHLCEIRVIAVIQHIRRSAAGRITDRPAEEDDLISKIRGIWLLGAITSVITVIAILLPRIPQPQSYHMFADQRSFLGIPNFNDVVSNLPFAAIGLWGLVFLQRSKCEHGRRHFLDERERWPYLIVFAGLLLTAFGSAYYHLRPGNARLVWDRVPMTIVFMSLVAAIIAERISLRAGLWLMPILLLIGVGSVVQWYLSELRGAGDLRFYAAVQAYSLLFLLIAVLLPSRYTRGRDLVIVAGFYVLAKALEALDKPIFELGHIVSGHTLKHLAAAGAGYWILRMLQNRGPSPVQRLTVPQGIPSTQGAGQPYDI
jgi:hypothetical protein